ncbi:hypothetical protein ABZP36_031828 [Zizania latifolia]
MACSAAAAAAASIVGEVFTEEEHEVAAILEELADLVCARSARSRRSSEGAVIPSWGCRRPRSMPEDKPAAPVLDRDQEAASPDTPLVFPDESGGDDADEPAAAPAAKKARTHAEWVQDQRAVVASLLQENANLSKQIEEYRDRLESSRSANDDLKQMHDKLKRQREQREEEDRVEATAAQARAIDWPAPARVLGLDLNEPPVESLSEDDEEAWWRLVDQQRAATPSKAAITAEARRRRREILRAKRSASRMRR